MNHQFWPLVRYLLNIIKNIYKSMRYNSFGHFCRRFFKLCSQYAYPKNKGKFLGCVKYGLHVSWSSYADWATIFPNLEKEIKQILLLLLLWGKKFRLYSLFTLWSNQMLQRISLVMLTGGPKCLRRWRTCTHYNTTIKLLSLSINSYYFNDSFEAYSSVLALLFFFAGCVLALLTSCMLYN